MSYKTILVHVNESPRLAERVKAAAAVADKFHGHVIGAGMTGVSRFMFDGPSVDTAMPYLAAQLDFANAQAKHALDRFDSEAVRYDGVHFERRLVEDDVAGGLALQARYADLVVMGQSDLDEPIAGGIPDLAAYVMLNSGRPVLIIPREGEFDAIHERVLVAWDASLSAARALANAMPLLRAENKVDIAVFNASEYRDAHGAEPGADIALYLSRHDVNVNVISRNTEGDTGRALLALAQERRSTSLVMGGYGHTRFREILMGGVTRTILDSMTLPVLMSH